MKNHHPECDQFHDLPVNTQVERIVARIRLLCQTLIATRSNMNWLIVWPEHGVQRPGGYLTLDEKDYLQAQFAAITADYPQLIIVAGTVKYAEYFLAHEGDAAYAAAEKVTRAYLALDWLHQRERVACIVRSDHKLFEHAEHVSQVARASGRKAMVKNVCFVFQHGSCVGQHAKIAPIDEVHTAYGVQETNHFFAVGNDEDKSCLIDVTLLNNAKITLAIEICREHILGVLQHEVQEKGLIEMPDLHLLLSDSIRYSADCIIGKCFIHVDTRSESIIAMRQGVTTRVNLILFQQDFFADDLGRDLDTPVRMLPYRNQHSNQEAETRACHV